MGHLTQNDYPAQSVLRGLGQSLLRVVPSAIAVGIVTGLSFAVRLNLATVSFLYLIIVVLQSLLADFSSSAVVSVICFLCLNYFFVPPLFSLRVSDASDTMALMAFLTTGLVITRLTSRAQNAANAERLQRESKTQLYELARQLLALKPETGIETGLLQQFRSCFGLRAVCLFEGASANLHLEGHSLDLAEKTRSAYIERRDFQDVAAGIAVRLIPAGDGAIGAIGFQGLQDCHLNADPLAALAEIVVERSAAFRRASQAVAATEAEIFRGAVLDALAHEFKTPLTTILTAAGGLKETGALSAAQRELADVVESEAFRLGQLTSRLLRLARLDREEVKPQIKLIDIAEIVEAMVDQYAHRWTDRQLHLKKASKLSVLGDRELLWLALGQLIDNACKHSRSGSEVTVSVESMNSAIAIHVWNSGPSIPERERSRIFDRFYRGESARKLTPGSGLGLYVARKIAIAHGGDLALEERSENNSGAGFVFTISNSREELVNDPAIQAISN
jgi:two-component system sensor histidine kinase KdpD